MFGLEQITMEIEKITITFEKNVNPLRLVKRFVSFSSKFYRTVDFTFILFMFLCLFGANTWGYISTQKQFQLFSIQVEKTIFVTLSIFSK